ncbi:hypothetical protein ASE95_08115 [Sphingomonas sp. Leaf231]|uniref:PEPxxWA-CTERM sorting domain-containing protein n=1 Tax=Sphingomonas sp. Leaf231 TaxID=1736301 RepID=UPI000701580E|nr:PEPxxWA-CTERM sorting domain-containing protein [Sphingomonas sp. Leaf231]KQN92641.1 hypothetical protein ASE95_08115 [Sphingomonas sp. Leaf231]
MKKHLLAGLTLLAAAVATPASAATSIGDVVTCGAANFSCSEEQATIGAGAEFGLDFDLLGTLLTADFSNGLLTIRNANNPDFADGLGFGNDFIVQFSNVTSAFTFASLGTMSDVFDFSESNISLDDDGFLTLDLSNTSFAPSGSLQVRLDQAPSQGAVPEPATWAMMILGFAVVGHALRRRKAAEPLLVRA